MRELLGFIPPVSTTASVELPDHQITRVNSEMSAVELTSQSFSSNETTTYNINLTYM